MGTARHALLVTGIVAVHPALVAAPEDLNRPLHAAGVAEAELGTRVLASVHPLLAQLPVLVRRPPQHLEHLVLWEPGHRQFGVHFHRSCSSPAHSGLTHSIGAFVRTSRGFLAGSALFLGLVAAQAF